MRVCRPETKVPYEITVVNSYPTGMQNWEILVIDTRTVLKRRRRRRSDTRPATLVESRLRSKLVPYGDFNGDCGIHTVLVVEIDALYIQALQTRLASRAHVLRITSHYGPAVSADSAKFRRQLHLVADTFNGLHAH